MLARSSSRYISATLAPTNRNGFCPTNKRPPRCRTNWSFALLLAAFGEATKKRPAALPTSSSAAITNSFLFINKINDHLSGIRHPHETHNRTNSPQHYKEVEECTDSESHRKVN